MTTLEQIRARWDNTERGTKEWADKMVARQEHAAADVHFLLSMVDDYEKLMAFAEELLDRSSPEPGCDELEFKYNDLRSRMELP